MRAFIVECKLPDRDSKADEVAAMARTIGYEIAAVMVQKRKSVHHSFCIGRGKLEDLRQGVIDKRIDIVILANTLPSAQVFKIQKELGGEVKVIDRNILILEVFDRRAMTVESKLQIQLAKLRYTFSWGKEFLKMRGILGEQVGWSGPGDYPYSEYQREARKRISRLENKLDEIYCKKSLMSNRRRALGYPILALAGYTQSGKTTFFNRIAAESKDTGLGPFTTLATCARRIDIADSPRRIEAILIDSIGFIEDMHPTILRAFFTTLGEIADSDVVLLFANVDEPAALLHRKLAEARRILSEIKPRGELVVCANKIDRIQKEECEAAAKTIRIHFPEEPVFFISAKTGENIGGMLHYIAGRLLKNQVLPAEKRL